MKSTIKELIDRAYELKEKRKKIRAEEIKIAKEIYELNENEKENINKKQ